MILVALFVRWHESAGMKIRISARLGIVRFRVAAIVAIEFLIKGWVNGDSSIRFDVRFNQQRNFAEGQSAKR